MCLVDYQRGLRVVRLGRTAYDKAMSLMDARAQLVRQAECDDTLYLLEHEPVITLGRNGNTTNLLATEDALRDMGIAIHHVGRGGDITYHGPGQLVGYPVVRLEPAERDIKRFVFVLEEILIRTLRDFGIRSERVDGLRGVWVGNEKIAALGVRIAKWTTTHGFALNVDTDLSKFDLMVPCGIQHKGVTSMAQLLGSPPALNDVMDRVSFHAGSMLDRAPYPVPSKEERAAA